MYTVKGAMLTEHGRELLVDLGFTLEQKVVEVGQPFTPNGIPVWDVHLPEGIRFSEPNERNGKIGRCEKDGWVIRWSIGDNWVLPTIFSIRQKEEQP